MIMIKETIKNYLVGGVQLLCWTVSFLRNENFHNYIEKKNRSKTVCILGNGSSLKYAIDTFVDIEKYDYCMVNYSPTSPSFFKIRPKFYVLVDGSFFFLPDKQKELKSALDKIDWDISLFVPFDLRYKIQYLIKDNVNINLVPFHNCNIQDNFPFKKLAYKLFKRGLAIPVAMNVAVACIYCMINSGFKTIHLYGLEHSWMSQIVVDENNNVCMKDTHFYDTGEVKLKIIKDCYGNKCSIAEQLRNQALAFASYNFLRGYADYLGDVEVINKTKNSFIDAFRKEIDY